MGYPVFYSSSSVFFVGGNGDKSGRTAYAGGCTQGWWDSQCPNGTDAEKTAALAKLMTDGGPAIEEMGCAYTSSNRRITKAGCFGNAEPGMVAYVEETPESDANLETMRYEITEVDAGGDWIETGDATGSDATVTVRIGGAFDSLQNALDATDAASHSVCIYTNLDEILAGPLDVDTGGGTTLQNTFKRIIGYNTVPGDLDRGGSLYQSPLDILKAGSVDAGRCVSFDADGGAFDVVEVSVDNVVFENLRFCNTSGSLSNAIEFTSIPKVVVFRNCRFTDTNVVYVSEADGVLFDSCYSYTRTHHYLAYGYGNVLLNCVGKMNASSGLGYATATGTLKSCCLHVQGCVVDGNGASTFHAVRAIVPSAASAVVIGNTFYNFGGAGLRLHSCDVIMAYDNVFVVDAAGYGVHAHTWSSGAGSLIESHNCWRRIDGSALVFVNNEAGISEPPVMNGDSMEADPEFADAANGDYRVRNAAVLRGGRLDAAGNAQQMGAVVQEYAFARRARMTNAGRAATFR